MKNIRSLNKLAKEYGLKLIQGNGYLYWIPISDNIQNSFNQLYDTSIATNKFSDLTFNRWLIELNEIIQRLEAVNNFIKFDT